VIIGLTGLAGCGKDTVARYLQERHGYKMLVFSDILVEEAKSRGMEPTKMNLSILGDDLRKGMGNAALAKKLLDKIDPENSYVISGFRSPEEVYSIQNEVIDFCLIFIDADKSTRFKRRRPEDPQAENEFFERDERDIENKGTGKVIEMADFTIVNNGSVDELYKKTEELLAKIEGESE
jgi:dephospho-CoA kinase